MPPMHRTKRALLLRTMCSEAKRRRLVAGRKPAPRQPVFMLLRRPSGELAGRPWPAVHSIHTIQDSSTLCNAYGVREMSGDLTVPQGQPLLSRKLFCSLFLRYHLFIVHLGPVWHCSRSSFGNRSHDFELRRLCATVHEFLAFIFFLTLLERINVCLDWGI